MSRTLYALFAMFAPLSVATVGGGQTIIADMQRQVVDVHHWMTHAQFVNDFAIARLAPGPGSLLATLVGFQVGGVAGALVATLALFGPTAFLMIAVAHMTSRHHDAPWQLALQAGLRPVAAGLILAAVYTLVQGLDGGWIAIATALVSTTLVMRTRVNALVLIAGGAALFATLHALGVL
ncbi:MULTISPECIES: chromate transporter [Burkholderia]|uniref:Chromate transporter n=1 Tax=Burkholderia gladioli TaxID=28095 RepID=A0A2A7SBJ2_BURGA|nr:MULTISPECIES: chromate transporter [Burkholderia]MBU9169456.1 chromate transporter [Burkholderia gladioli]MBU9380042.1 chromate transporter [Burkholderia gladioli]MBU9424413.1 chromate transporter [Burkholderia gladioli]MDN7739088.1 chromate transporter [Burkholderia gladioli]MDN8061373.1 chromate transporter [Burkholderia gladioli]